MTHIAVGWLLWHADAPTWVWVCFGIGCWWRVFDVLDKK